MLCEQPHFLPGILGSQHHDLFVLPDNLLLLRHALAQQGHDGGQEGEKGRGRKFDGYFLIYLIYFYRIVITCFLGVKLICDIWSSKDKSYSAKIKICN